MPSVVDGATRAPLRILGDEGDAEDAAVIFDHPPSAAVGIAIRKRGSAATIGVGQVGD